MKTIIITRAQTSDDRALAVAHVARAYFERFGTLPLESALYLIACIDSLIVGAIGLDFEGPNGKLPLEIIYKIDRSQIPFPITTSNGAQFGRWSATTADVSLPLLYAASLYAISNKRLYGWLNHTQSVHRILTRKGIKFTRIEAQLVMENVRAEDRLFYTQHKDIECYIMELRHVVGVLPKILETLSHTFIFNQS